MNPSQSDALVFSGATGDLAYKWGAKRPAHYLAIPPLTGVGALLRVSRWAVRRGARGEVNP